MGDVEWGQLFAKLLVSFLFGTIPFILLFASGPPQHGSWWYPNPKRWDYGFKLLLYAILDANTPAEPAGRWFVRGVAVIVLVMVLGMIWFR